MEIAEATGIIIEDICRSMQDYPMFQENKDEETLDSEEEAGAYSYFRINLDGTYDLEIAFNLNSDSSENNDTEDEEIEVTYETLELIFKAEEEDMTTTGSLTSADLINLNVTQTIDTHILGLQTEKMEDS